MSSNGDGRSTSAVKDPKIRHEWYQTDAEVVVSVFIKNVKGANFDTEIQTRSLSLSVKLPTGADVIFDLDPLSHDVVPAQSSARALSTKIEVKLIKAKPGIKWHKLEGEDDESTSMQASSNRTGPSYPTSARHKTNWDKLAKEAAEEESKLPDNKDPNSGGEVELNRLFKKLYADATDDQRMAMMKSYSESSGTSLSTNWDEVKKGKVQTQPPDGMYAKKW